MVEKNTSLRLSNPALQPLCKKHHDRKTLTMDINPEYKY